MTDKSLWTGVRVLGEPLLVLFLAALAVSLLSLPFLPRDARMRVALPDPAGGGPPLDEALSLVREAHLARSVRIESREGGGTLLLVGVEDPEGAEERLHSLLDREGAEVAVRPSDVLDLDALVGGDLGPLPALIAVQAAVIGAAGWLARRARVRAERWPRAGLVRSAIWGVGAGVAALVASGLLALGLDALGLEVEEQDWIQRMFRDPATVLRLAPYIALVGPLAEELFFRGYVLAATAQDLGLWVGIAFSSLLFAAVHLNLSGLPVYLVIGVVFGWAYHRSGRLLTPVLGHVTLNCAVLLRVVLPEP